MAAANQVRELQVLRQPTVMITFRAPNQLTGEDQIPYGRGDGQYRRGTPIYVDVWNVGTPTIMIMEVILDLERASDGDGKPLDVEGAASCDATPNNGSTPQLLVESGKVESINIAYSLMHQVTRALNQDFINPQSGTTATAHFAVKFLAAGDERIIESRCDFKFVVINNQIYTAVGGNDLLTGGGGSYSVAGRSHK